MAKANPADGTLPGSFRAVWELPFLAGRSRGRFLARGSSASSREPRLTTCLCVVFRTTASTTIKTCSR